MMLLKESLALQDTSETMHADTYVWSDAEDPDLYGEWDFEVRVSNFSLWSIDASDFNSFSPTLDFWNEHIYCYYKC